MLSPALDGKASDLHRYCHAEAKPKHLSNPNIVMLSGSEASGQRLLTNYAHGLQNRRMDFAYSAEVCNEGGSLCCFFIRHQPGAMPTHVVCVGM